MARTAICPHIYRVAADESYRKTWKHGIRLPASGMH